MQELSDGEKNVDDMFSCFDTIPEFREQTDGQVTDGWRNGLVV